MHLVVYRLFAGDGTIVNNMVLALFFWIFHYVVCTVQQATGRVENILQKKYANFLEIGLSCRLAHTLSRLSFMP